MVVHIPILLRHNKRQMRTNKSYGKEKRLFLLFQFFQILYAFISDLPIQIVLFRKISMLIKIPASAFACFLLFLH